MDEDLRKKKFEEKNELHAELSGIQQIQEFVRTPQIVEVKELEIHYEYIQQGKPDFIRAGRDLAKLHNVSNEFFGLKPK